MNKPLASDQQTSAADYSETESSKAAGLLRLTIPLLSKHKIPATPDNYAVWYGYVSGEAPALQEEVDRLIAQGTSFTEEVNAQLHRRFIAERGLNDISSARTDLSELLVELGGQLRAAGVSADEYGGTLASIADDVAAKDDIKDIQHLIEVLVVATRAMKQSTDDMQGEFEAKSQKVEELREQLDMERQRAITDPLTQLGNRAALFDCLSRCIQEMPEGDPPAVIMLDIDHFKAVNDGHGHLTGDRVIRFVAQVLRKSIKGQDYAARYGGEEFTVVLPQTPLNGAAVVADTIRKTIESAQLVRADNKKKLGQITISAGVTVCLPGEDPAASIDRADKALYQSKHDGRNRVTISS